MFPIVVLRRWVIQARNPSPTPMKLKAAKDCSLAFVFEQFAKRGSDAFFSDRP